MNYFRINLAITSYLLIAGCVGGSGIGNGISKYSPITTICQSCSLDSACAHEYFDSAPEWAGVFTLSRAIDAPNAANALISAELEAQAALVQSIIPSETTYTIDPARVSIPNEATLSPNGEIYVVVGRKNEVLNIIALNATGTIDFNCNTGLLKMSTDDFARAVFAEEGCGQALKTEFGFKEGPCNDTPQGCHQNSPYLLIFILNLLLIFRSIQRPKSDQTKKEPHAKI